MTLTIPYFEDFDTYFSEYVLTLLYKIEELFNEIDYVGHEDSLVNYLNMFPHSTAKDKADLALTIYRNHIDIVFSMQGVLLSDPYNTKLSVLVELLHALVLLGNKPLKELLVWDHLELEDTDEDFMAQVMSQLTDLTLHDVLENISQITRSTIEYLKNNIPMHLAEKDYNAEAKERFLKYSSQFNHANIAIGIVKELNTFNYIPNIAILGFIDRFEPLLNSELTDRFERVSNEILLFVLGGNTPIHHVEAMTIDCINKVIDNTSLKLKMNAYISHVCKIINENEKEANDE